MQRDSRTEYGSRVSARVRARGERRGQAQSTTRENVVRNSRGGTHVVHRCAGRGGVYMHAHSHGMHIHDTQHTKSIAFEYSSHASLKRSCPKASLPFALCPSAFLTSSCDISRGTLHTLTVYYLAGISDRIFYNWLPKTQIKRKKKKRKPQLGISQIGLQTNSNSGRVSLH